MDRAEPMWRQEVVTPSVTNRSGLTWMSVLAAAVLGGACSMTSDEVVGLYRLQYPYGVEQLRLSAGGEYEQSFRANDEGPSILHRGHWRLEPSGGWWHGEPAMLILMDCMLIDDFTGKPRPSAERIQSGQCGFHMRKVL